MASTNVPRRGSDIPLWYVDFHYIICVANYYIVGFSRGAYQVRVLAGMIHEVWEAQVILAQRAERLSGRVDKDADGEADWDVSDCCVAYTSLTKRLGRAYDHYEAIRSKKPKTRQIAREFKNTFSWKDLGVHFVGVW